MNSSVYISSCKEYKSETILDLLRASIKNYTYPSFRGCTLLLKPNILMPVAEKGTCALTHPLFIRAVAIFLKELGTKKLLIGESPAVHDGTKCATKTGVIDAVKDLGVEWVPFDKTVTITPKDPLIHGAFTVTSVVKEVDRIINLPKMKTHMMLYFTGAMKNLFGVICGLDKSRYHFRYPDKDDFGMMIADLNSALPPTFTFVDAITAMEGKGPLSGTERQVERLLLSENPLAVDYALTEMMGYDPLTMPSIKGGMKTPLGQGLPEAITYPELLPQPLSDYKKITVLSDFSFNTGAKKWIGFLIRKLLLRRPQFSVKSCVKCGLCVKICSPQALSLKSEKKVVQIQKKKCIRCYCCHEICPEKAVKVGLFE